MGLKMTARLTILHLLFTAVTAFGLIAPRATPNPGRTPHYPSRGNNFVDFALGSANSCGTNYGQMIDEGRIVAAEETIESAYFWSNVVSLLFVLGLGVVVFFLWRERDEREIVVSERMVSYHNQLIDAEEKIDQYDGRYRLLTESIDQQAEAALSAKAQSQKSEVPVQNGHAKDASKQLPAGSPNQQTGNDETRRLQQGITSRDAIIDSLKKKVIQLSRQQSADNPGEGPKDVS